MDAHLHYGKWHDIEVEDDVTAYLEYENGATGCFITSTGDPHGSNRFEIQMDGAQLIAENNGLFVHELDTLEPEFTKVCKNAFDCPSGHDLEVETDGENPQHNGVLNAWANAILRDGNMVADGREGIRGLTLSNAMHLSSWIGDTVELPFDEDLFYEELMKRVATSRRKDDTVAKVADLSNTYGGAVDAKEGFKKHWDTKW